MPSPTMDMDVDLSSLPLAFLESYPFPAFVLVTSSSSRRPPLISRDTDLTVRDAVSPLSGPPAAAPSPVSVLWCNARFRAVTEGRPLAECAAPAHVQHLLAWAESDDEEAFAFEMRRGALLLAKTSQPVPHSHAKAYCIITSVRASDAPATPSGRSSMSTDISYFSSVSASVGASASAADPSPFSAPRPHRTRQGSRTTKPVDAASDPEQLLELYDWLANTSLGPREQWPDAIHGIIMIMMRSTSQDALWLGPDLNLIYNKNYSHLTDHPNSWGRPAREVWAAVWDSLGPSFERAWQGESLHTENGLYLYRESGSSNTVVERYHTFSLISLVSDGQTVGIYNPSVETTDQVIAKRRQETTRDMSEHLLVVRNQKEYYDGVVDVLSRNAHDAPFVICYRVEEGDTLELTLEAQVGVPPNHPAAPPKLTLPLPGKQANFGPNTDRLSSPTLSAISHLSSGSGGHRVTRSHDPHFWPIAKAIATRQIVIMENCSSLVQGFPIRQWDVLPDSALIIPVCSDSSLDTPCSVMIIGINAYRPFDTVYEDWIQIMRAHFTSSLMSVKAYEQEVQRTLEKERIERAKSNWFQGAAHDLRSPLALIAGPLDDLLRTQLTPEQKHVLGLAQRNVGRLQRLVNNLLDFSRIEAGRLEGRFVPLDIGRFVQDIATLFRPAVERLRLKFIVEIEARETLVHVDPTLFETVLTNILSNALKYTQHGSIRLRVAYTDYAEISVMDTGFGIPQAELSLVTDRFHRASTALGRGTEGTGIGLALAKEIVRLHEGELLIMSKTANESADSTHGSTFTVRLPLAPKNVRDDAVDSDFRSAFGAYGKAVARDAFEWAAETSNSDSDAGTANESVNGSGSGRSDGFLFEKSDQLLLVDDNVEMRTYIKSLFSPYCKVIEAANGTEALRKAIANPPNLILSDLMMKEMDGQALLENIRQHASTRFVPIVLLSAATDDDTRLRALMAGAEDFMNKPFKPKELIARVHLHMQMGKKRATLEALFAQREQEIALLSDYCPSGIMRADKNGNMTYANTAWLAYAGMPAHEDLNRWPQYCDEETRTRLAPIWQDILTGDKRETDLKWQWANGRSMSGVFIRLDKVHDGMSGILGCLTDMTLQEQQLRDSERRRIEAEESKRQQELLVDLTSHEIRTPVSAILQCSSLVKENLMALKEQLKFVATSPNGFRPTPELLKDLDEDVEALESIYQCGLTQERIAGDVLSLARIQLDMLSLHDVAFDIKKEGRKVFSVFASEAKMKRIELKLDFGPLISARGITLLKTDPVRLGQVVTNLISNAIRFTASSDRRQITVRFDLSFVPPHDNSCALPDDGDDIAASALGLGLGEQQQPVPPPEDTPVWLFVSVRDTGPGLGPKELGVLFQRFQQGNKMIHTRYGGSGLGLFICKRITELLGGRIEVVSELGHGSTFRFFISSRTAAPAAVPLSPPVAPSPTSPGPPGLLAATAAVGAANIATGVATVNASVPPPLAVGPLNVLIVEDNIINQTVLKRQLAKAGLSCDTANDGFEALQGINEAYRQSRRAGAVTRRPYDVVLMDLEMPIMDGLTAVRKIRESEANGTLSKQLVIALTGNARQAQIDQALAAGMDDVVIKPYVLPDLIQKMRLAVQQRRLQAAQAAEDD
ncbi:hypothetical protein Q5752_005540 [Cryptotrichosporon argae]